MMRASTPSTKDAKQAVHFKFLWLRQVCTDPDIGHLACRVAGLLIDHINSSSGEAWPSQSRLAAASSVTPRAIQYALKKLIARGHLKARRKRGLNNRYKPMLKPTNARSLVNERPTNVHSKTNEPSFALILETPLNKPVDEAERRRLGREMSALAKRLGGRSSGGVTNA